MLPNVMPHEFDTMLTDQGDHVWRLIVRILGDDGHDAADVFQQAFVELTARQRRSSDVRNAAALLKRIATARAIDVVRRKIRDRKTTHDTDEALIAARKQYQPDARAEAGELLDDLRAALTELPEQQSAAFVLTQIEDMSHVEAAAAIGVTANHVGVLLHRARATLRESLQSHSPLREARP
jgi:RNA polymerase sigma factor (sigma-70 family)